MGNNFFREYPDTIVASICDGSPFIIGLGTVTPTTATRQLTQLGVQLFKCGLQPTVTMRINAYRSVSTLVGQSQIFNVSDIETAYPATNQFYGWVRFTFSPRLNLPINVATRFELELFNYSYNETTSWIGAIYDWPVTMGYNTSPGQVTSSPMAIELYGAESFP